MIILPVGLHAKNKERIQEMNSFIYFVKANSQVDFYYLPLVNPKLKQRNEQKSMLMMEVISFGDVKYTPRFCDHTKVQPLCIVMIVG